MKKALNAVCGLLLGEFDENRLIIRDVFRNAGWTLIEPQTLQEGLDHVEKDSAQVVIVRSEFSGGDWKEVLQNLKERPQLPQLIVTSRTADEQLWSEVLNCGGYDVLAEPFDREEVERVVAAAWRHYGPPRALTAGGVIPFV